MSATTTRPRVVVADDSALMRRIVSNVLVRDGLEVVGAARDGDEALELCEREQPDAMTLDLTMPGMSGLDVLRRMRRRGTMIPVVVVSAFSPAHGAHAVDALAEGAFELVPKPSGSGDVAAFEQNLLAKIKLATGTHRLGRHGARPTPPRPAVTAPPTANGALPPATPRPRRPRTGLARALVIATSTGGPRALASLVPDLPSPLGLGTIIVQHMPAGFTSSLAARLDRGSALTVREAAGGETWDPAAAYVAPGGRHLRLTGAGHAVLSDEDPLGGLRPRADLLIEDAAARWGDRLTLVVLTGMGNDGLRGAHEVRRRGGRVLVEAEETCTVYGMPRAIAEAGLADEVLPLHRMSAAIAAEVNP